MLTEVLLTNRSGVVGAMGSNQLHSASRGGWLTKSNRPPMRFVVRAEQGNGSNSSDQSEPKSRRRRRSKQPIAPQPEDFTLENLNPISMGRKSRVIFDDIWTQLQRIGGISRSLSSMDSLPFDLPEVFDSPQAADTTILVVGATGRVGRILVRKLLLRGYKVRALVRQRDSETASTESIPQSVQVIPGDVGDYKACRAAVQGADKVIFCAAARTTLTADLNRVDDAGVATIAKALQDERNTAARRQHRVDPLAAAESTDALPSSDTTTAAVATDAVETTTTTTATATTMTTSSSLAATSKIDIADFGREEYHPFWDIEHVGPPPEDLNKKGFYVATRRKTAERARDLAEAYINEEDCLVFEGAVYSRDGYADMGAPMTLPHDQSLSGTEGLVFRVKGDGQPYTVLIETDDGSTFASKINPRQGYSTLRMPFNSFLPAKGVDDDALLDPGTIQHLRIRFEPKNKFLDQVTQPGQSVFDNSANRFHLEIDWIKALPGGTESDFILVSCAGGRKESLNGDDTMLMMTDESLVRDRVTSAKRRGEAALRNSGLGYTIVRPGPLAEEAGGYKALVFDQGNRITEGISCADVADVCLKALHDPLARNKTFEVCWEYTPEDGLESYELVAHLPDKMNNYLSPALATLQRNT